MKQSILILGASYGSLLGTKLLMAGHRVTLVCTAPTAELINRDGTEVRIKLVEENNERLQAFCSVTFDNAFVVRDLKIIEGTNEICRALANC
jgi:ketopantoate reductase